MLVGFHADFCQTQAGSWPSEANTTETRRNLDQCFRHSVSLLHSTIYIICQWLPRSLFVMVPESFTCGYSLFMTLRWIIQTENVSFLQQKKKKNLLKPPPLWKKGGKREARASCFLPDSTVCVSYNFTSEPGWVLHFGNYRNYMCAMNSLYWVWGDGKGGRTTSSQREHRIFQPMCLFLLTL